MLTVFFYGKQDRDKELYDLYKQCVEYYVGTLVKWDEDEREEPGVCFSRDGKELEFLSGVPTQEQIKSSFTKFF